MILITVKTVALSRPGSLQALALPLWLSKYWSSSGCRDVVPFQRAVVQLVSIQNYGSYRNLEVSMNMCVARHMQIGHTDEHR